MIIYINRAIGAIFLMLSLGCSERNSERSVVSEKSPAARQAEAKADSETSEIKQLEKRAEGGDPTAKLELAKAVLRNRSSADRFTRAKSLLIEASQKGSPEAKLGLLLLLSTKSISSDGLPDIAALREEMSSTGDGFVAAYFSAHDSPLICRL